MTAGDHSGVAVHYGNGAGLWRSADRDFDTPDRLWDYLGFRPLRDL